MFVERHNNKESLHKDLVTFCTVRLPYFYEWYVGTLERDLHSNYDPRRPYRILVTGGGGGAAAGNGREMGAVNLAALEDQPPGACTERVLTFINIELIYGN